MSEQNHTLKIVAIGDSITFGYPFSPEYSWLNLAANRLNIDAVNAGINGDTTEGMLSRFCCDVICHKPSHVVIMGGTNDAYGGAVADNVCRNIFKMTELALENRIVPIIALPIPCNDFIVENLLSQYRAKMCGYAEANNIQFIDFQKSMVNVSGMKIKADFYCDGLHPNEAGYNAMAEVFYSFLVRLVIESRVHTCYWEHDFSCAITTLIIMSELFQTELNDQVFDAAYGLNAGRLRTQCGLVEGALLFIGMYARHKGVSLEATADLCRTFALEFQKSFGSVLCSELRPEGFRPNNPPHLCEQLSKRAIAFSAHFVSQCVMQEKIEG